MLMNKPLLRGLRRRSVILLLACVVIGVIALFRPSKPIPFMVLRQPVKMPVPLRGRLTQRIPNTPGWAWFWKIEEKVLGQRTPVNLSALIVTVPESAEPTLSSLLLGAPSFSAGDDLQ